MTDAAPDPVLYVRASCHLCELFLIELSMDLGAAFERLAVVDVDQDAALAAEYGMRVPVLAQAGRVVCEGVYDRLRVREALRV